MPNSASLCIGIRWPPGLPKVRSTPEAAASSGPRAPGDREKIGVEWRPLRASYVLLNSTGKDHGQPPKHRHIPSPPRASAGIKRAAYAGRKAGSQILPYPDPVIRPESSISTTPQDWLQWYRRCFQAGTPASPEPRRSNPRPRGQDRFHGAPDRPSPVLLRYGKPPGQMVFDRWRMVS